MFFQSSVSIPMKQQNQIIKLRGFAWKLQPDFFGGLKLSGKDFQELDWSRLIWEKHPLHGDSYFVNVKEQLARRCDFSISKNTGHLRRWTRLLEVKQEIYPVKPQSTYKLFRNWNNKKRPLNINKDIRYSNPVFNKTTEMMTAGNTSKNRYDFG